MAKKKNRFFTIVSVLDEKGNPVRMQMIDKPITEVAEMLGINCEPFDTIELKGKGK